MPQFRQDFSPLSLEWVHDNAASRKAEGWRYVQTLAVNTEDGVDLVYSYMKDGVLDNKVIRDVPRDAVVPSITDLYLEAFVFENEIHDLFGVTFEGIAIDFGGNFYHLSVREPMTIISPEQKAAREKARKIAEAKAAKEAKAAAAAAANAEFVAEHPEVTEAAKKKSGKVIEPSAEDNLEEKLAGMDPEKVARVRAAMAAKAKKAKAEAEAAQKAESAAKEAELEAKLANMDPEKAAKVRAAMAAKAKKAQAEAASAQADDNERQGE